MNTDDFGLDYVTIGGGDFVPAAVNDFAKKTIEKHYLLAGAALLLLTLTVIYFMWFKSEAFNPTQTLRAQDGDQFGLGNREFLANGPDRSQSAFAQQTQSQGQGSLIVAPGNSSSPGSLAYQVLNSADFDCANRKSVGDNAWDWMNGVVHENAVGRPQNDNDFSKVLSGR